MSHSLHGRWGDHNGHGNLEPQHGGAQVNASDVHENAGAEPAGAPDIHQKDRAEELARIALQCIWSNATVNWCEQETLRLRSPLIKSANPNVKSTSSSSRRVGKVYCLLRRWCLLGKATGSSVILCSNCCSMFVGIWDYKQMSEAVEFKE